MVDQAILIYDLMMLSKNFYKVIEVNLDEDTYFEVKISEDEPHVYSGVRHWMDEFIKGGGVYEEDIPQFKEFFDPFLLKKDLPQKWKRVYYRRKFNDDWRMVCMEVIPCDSYCEEEPIVLIVVRDVEDYIKDFKQQYDC